MAVVTSKYITFFEFKSCYFFRFLADRFVFGTCANCKFEDARGDQCDGCGKLLDPIEDLIQPKCHHCKTHPQIRQSKHIFLKLDTLQVSIPELFIFLKIF